MYILFNLAISNNFGWIDWASLENLWPVEMKVDYGMIIFFVISALPSSLG